MSELFVYVLERACERWEAENGPVDWDRFPLLDLSREHQDELLHADPDAYAAGLPPFVRDLLERVCTVERAATDEPIDPDVLRAFRRAS